MVMRIPLPNISGAGGEYSETLGCVDGVHGQTELRVIGILMILDAVLRDDVTHHLQNLRIGSMMIPPVNTTYLPLTLYVNAASLLLAAVGRICVSALFRRTVITRG